MKISRTLAAAIAAISFSQAHALDLQLKDRQLGVNHMGFSTDGARACLAGDSFDSEEAQSSGELLVIDYKRNAVLWKKHIPAPDGNAALTSRQCVFDGDNVYLLANVNTQKPRSLNQSLVYIYQFDADGKQLGYKELLVPGRNKFGLAIGSSSSGVLVAGYSKDEDQDTEYNSMFTVTVDKRLAEGKVNLRKTGAFDHNSAARFVGDQLFIAGQFNAAKLKQQDYVTDYAQSRVLANGGYAWSVRPFKQEQRSVETGISPRGIIYSLGANAGTSTLAVTSAEGKQIASASYQGKLCDTLTIAEFGDAVMALREPCRGQGTAAELVVIAPASGKETALKLVSGEPLFATTNNNQWFVVAKDGKKRLSLQFGAIKE